MNAALAFPSPLPRRPALHALMLVTLLALLVLGATACSASLRQRELRGTLVTLDAARDGFVAWDAGHQTAIVAAAPNEPAGAATLAAYRADRAKVAEAFEVAYRALALAATDDKLSPVGLAELEALKTAVEAIEKP